MRIPTSIVLATLTFACSHGRWNSQPADRPLSSAELGIWNVTVTGGAGANELREAMAAAGFKIVSHPPYNHDLEVVVRFELATLSAHLITDGFHVAYAQEEASAEALHDPQQVRALAAALTARLARSDGLAFFVRNSGVPAQTMFTN